MMHLNALGSSYASCWLSVANSGKHLAKGWAGCMHAERQHAFGPRKTVFSLVYIQVEQQVMLYGRTLAKSLKASVAHEVVSLKMQIPSFRPRLAIVQAGKMEPAAESYTRAKLRAAARCGIEADVVQLDQPDLDEKSLADCIGRLNQDPTIHGIMLHLPLPAQLREMGALDLINPRKDVEGLTSHNTGELARRSGFPNFVPCTPAAVMALIRHSKTPLQGASAVVIGRSEVVGQPLAWLLDRANATVTGCHEYTRDISNYTRSADVVVVAVGSPGYLKPEAVSPTATIIDVGINVLKSGEVVGDVDSLTSDVCPRVSSVPGGVGPVTVAILMRNVLRAAKMAHGLDVEAPDGLSHAEQSELINLT